MKCLLASLVAAAFLMTTFINLPAAKADTGLARIVGGLVSDPAQWPAVVSLKYNGEHFCGGTLVADRWVLTAAHCLFNNGNLLPLAQITATVGEYDLNSSPTSPATALIQFFIHPGYDLGNQNNDLALLQLAAAIDNETVELIDLNETLELIEQQHPVTAIGWGSTVGYQSGETPTPNYPTLLNEVEVLLETDAQCSENLGNNYTTEMICAGYPEGGKDSCQGDSGGPLMVNSNFGWQQIGITSWGYGCAAPNSPGVYTRVGVYKNWIESQIINPFIITPTTTFAPIAINNSSTKMITISNRSDTPGNFNYQLTGSPYFSFEPIDCENITTYTSCEFPVTYNPLSAGEHSATITVTSDIVNASTQFTEVYGSVLITAKPSSSSSGALGIFSLLLLPLVYLRYFFIK